MDSLDPSPQLSLAAAPERATFYQLRNLIERNYSIHISENTLADSAKARFSGSSIIVNEKLPWDEKSYLILHLAGHAIHISTDRAALQFTERPFNTADDPRFEAEILAYEMEANRYAAGLLFDARQERFLDWYSRYVQVDLNYFLHFCKTGKYTNFENYILQSPPTLSPLWAREYVNPVTIEAFDII